MKRQIITDNQGVSLLELVVAIAIFISMMLLVTGIFRSVVEGQRSAIAAQNTQESMRYAFEVMSKEIRNAQRSDDGCEIAGGDAAVNKVYNIETATEMSDVLYFRNKDSVCVYYYSETDVNGVDRLVIERGGGGAAFYVTPDEISVNNLEFVVIDDAIPAFHSKQPKVTITMEIEMAGGKAMHKQPMIMQTTISSRYYE